MLFPINNYTGIPVLALILQENYNYSNMAKIHKAVSIYKHSAYEIEIYNEYGDKIEISLYDSDCSEAELREKGTIAFVTEDSVAKYEKYIHLTSLIEQQEDKIFEIEDKLKKDEVLLETLFKEKKQIIIFLKNEPEFLLDSSKRTKDYKEPQQYKIITSANTARSRWYYNIESAGIIKKINISKDIRNFFEGTPEELYKLKIESDEINRLINIYTKEKDEVIDSFEWHSILSDEVVENLDMNCRFPEFKYTTKGEERVVEGDKRVEEIIKILIAKDNLINPKDIQYIEIDKLSIILTEPTSRFVYGIQEIKELTRDCDVIKVGFGDNSYSFFEKLMIPISQLSLVLKENPLFLKIAKNCHYDCDIDEAEKISLEKKLHSVFTDYKQASSNLQEIYKQQEERKQTIKALILELKKMGCSPQGGEEMIKELK